MSPGPEDSRDEKVTALSDRFGLPLERWSFGRTPVWARGALDPRDLVQRTLVDVAHLLDDAQLPIEEGILSRIRQALCDRILEGVRVAGNGVSSGATSVDQSSRGGRLHAPLGEELTAQYEAGLRRLTPLDREAVIARAELGLPWSELTRLLDKPGVDAARMAVSRALVRLAREMSHEHQ
jgi:DNA-directed RNA polymerase specialized sigma24 family protein